MKLYRKPRAFKTGFKSAYYGMPRSKAVVFKYCESLSLTPAASVSVYRYSANGCYDPDITGTGHQPMGFDNLMAFYDQYTVVGSKIQVNWVNDNPKFAQVGIYLNDDTSAPTTLDLEAWMEQSNSKYGVMTAKGGSKDTITQKAKFSAKRDLSVSKPLTADRLQGTAGSNPNEQMYYDLYYFAQNDTTAGSIHAIITITYFAVLTERKDIVTS